MLRAAARSSLQYQSRSVRTVTERGAHFAGLELQGGGQAGTAPKRPDADGAMTFRWCSKTYVQCGSPAVPHRSTPISSSTS